MEDIKTLIIGILGGVVVLALSKAYRAYRIKTLKQDIEFLEFEKNHLAEMKRSSVERNRSSFRALFAVLMFIALANFLPILFSLAGLFQSGHFNMFVNLILWGMVLGLSGKFWRRYDNLKNFKEATQKMEEKLARLKEKILNFRRNRSW